jgi:GntR family transcriptional regulator
VTDFESIFRDANHRLSAEVRASGQSVWAADADGRRVDVLDLTVSYQTAPEDVADNLGTGRALLRDRVYAVDGRRVCWAKSWLPAVLVEGTVIEQDDTGPGGTPARLAELGFEPVKFTEDVEFLEATDVGAEVRGKLGIDGHTSVVRIVRWNGTSEGRVVEATEMYLVAGAYRFRWSWNSHASG